MIDKKKIQSKPLLDAWMAIIILITILIITYKDARVGIATILFYAAYMFSHIVTDNPEKYSSISK